MPKRSRTLVPRLGRRARRYAAVVVVLGATLAAVLVATVPASAAAPNSGVYAVAPKWGGFCPDSGRFKGNKVTFVKWTNLTTGKSGGDGGDDVVWIPVRNNARNDVNISVTCRWSTPVGMSYRIKPTRQGQTFWFLLGGGFRSN